MNEALRLRRYRLPDLHLALRQVGCRLQVLSLLKRLGPVNGQERVGPDCKPPNAGLSSGAGPLQDFHDVNGENVISLSVPTIESWSCEIRCNKFEETMRRKKRGTMTCAMTVACMLVHLAASAQVLSDFLRFDPPPGQVDRRPQLVAYTEMTNDRRSYCRVAVSNPQPSTGDRTRDLGMEWTETLLAAYRNLEPPAAPIEGATPGKLPFISVQANGGESTARFTVRLFGFSIDHRRFSVSVMSADAPGLAQCIARAQPFFASLSLTAAAPTQPAGTAAGEPRTADTTRRNEATGTARHPGYRGDGIAGVWMAYTQSMLGQPFSPSWLVFFNDGQYMRGLPDRGMLDFDLQAFKAQGRPNSFGSYTWDGTRGVARIPGVKFEDPLSPHTNGQLKVRDTPFLRVVDVDGVTLDGAWTSFANPADPSIDTPPLGQRALIRFTRDGRFSDEGLFAVTPLRWSYADMDNGAGQGTYTVKDYTLVLRYADGRVRQVALTGFLGNDPRRNADSLFIGRMLLQRRP